MPRRSLRRLSASAVFGLKNGQQRHSIESDQAEEQVGRMVPDLGSPIPDFGTARPTLNQW